MANSDQASEPISSQGAHLKEPVNMAHLRCEYNLPFNLKLFENNQGSIGILANAQIDKDTKIELLSGSIRESLPPTNKDLLFEVSFDDVYCIVN